MDKVFYKTSCFFIIKFFLSLFLPISFAQAKYEHRQQYTPSFTCQQLPSLDAQKPFEHIRYLTFAGGGGRGFSYFPTLRHCAQEYGLDFQKIKGAAGTSAGSIAALMSLIVQDLSQIDKIYEEIPSRNFKDFSWMNLFFFNTEKGLYQGEELRNWLVHNVYEMTGLIDPSFEELYEYNGKTLKIYVTNLTKGRLVELSHHTAPQEKVVRSVLISSALPFAFKPRKNTQGDFLVDGGLLKNYPIDAYDYFDQEGTRYPNPATLGFYARSPFEEEEFMSPEKSLLEYLQSIFETVTHHEAQTLALTDKRRTVLINCPKDLGLIKMKIKHEQFEAINKAAQESLAQFITSYSLKGEYPSIWAVNKSYAPVLDYLYRTGEFTDFVDDKGHSSLMRAVVSYRRDIVRQLLDFQVNLCWKNLEHQSAYQMAEDLELVAISTMIYEEMLKKAYLAIEREEVGELCQLIEAGVDLRDRLTTHRKNLFQSLLSLSKVSSFSELIKQECLPTLKLKDLFYTIQRGRLALSWMLLKCYLAQTVEWIFFNLEFLGQFFLALPNRVVRA